MAFQALGPIILNSNRHAAAFTLLTPERVILFTASALDQKTSLLPWFSPLRTPAIFADLANALASLANRNAANFAGWSIRRRRERAGT
jgi:hypothetical protein